jgi:hypothetical protein
MEDYLSTNETTVNSIYFLKFPNEKTSLSKLKSAGFINEENEIITASHNHSIDVIGIITQGGEYDKEGNVIVQPTTLPGWHINYVGELPIEWEEYLVTPEFPVRVFM